MVSTDSTHKENVKAPIYVLLKLHQNNKGIKFHEFSL